MAADSRNARSFKCEKGMGESVAMIPQVWKIYS